MLQETNNNKEYLIKSSVKKKKKKLENKKQNLTAEAAAVSERASQCYRSGSFARDTPTPTDRQIQTDSSDRFGYIVKHINLYKITVPLGRTKLTSLEFGN